MQNRRITECPAPPLCAALILALGIAAGPVLAQSDPEPYRQTRVIMGTRFEIQVYDKDAARAEKAVAQAFEAVGQIDRLLNNYTPASELSAMNRGAASQPFHASPELFSFVKECRRFHEASAGAFDPTVGAIVRAWGFFSTRPGRPTDAAINAAKAVSGFDKVRLDNRARTVSYAVAGLEIDPGGIGKGFAVDKALAVLKKSGIRSALISAGGSTIYGLGKPPGQSGWKIAMRDPATRQALGYLELRNNSLSSSGVSEQSVREGAARISHIIDPRTGDPVADMCQVTAVAPTGTESEALTKAAFILTRDSLLATLKGNRKSHVLRVEGPCGAGRVIWTTPWSNSQFTMSPGSPEPAGAGGL